MKLSIDGTKIVFSDPLESVQQELEKIVDAIVLQSSNLPRPENTIARSDKMHLWDVKIDDELQPVRLQTEAKAAQQRAARVATHVSRSTYSYRTCHFAAGCLARRGTRVPQKNSERTFAKVLKKNFEN